MGGARLQHTILALLLLAAASYEGGTIAWVAKALIHPKDVPSAPFTLQNATRTIADGPLSGDQILSINGQPFTAKRQFDDAVFLAAPGTKIRLVLSEPSGHAMETDVVVGDQTRLSDSAAAIALTLCLTIF
ncbi:MAG TPA: hypothetical protein VHA14_02700, partial [Bryobacteraceae bacterium]|nr:hypothetical protein [Bryobacteraceae bacterium]